ncbi:MAG: T9SS type A sorting domain-containing protein [Fimbriimonadaceae bacterium]|nr:T9SS type A sorting domain-containing protein [Chitinophagales bacterium]
MQKYFLKIIITGIFISITQKSFSQSPDVMLQGWNWNYPYFYTGIGNQIDFLAAEGENLKNAGFTYIWLPPLAKSISGYTSMGYNVRDYYDIGDYGPARWGDREGFENIKSVYNSLEINMVADMIFNHRDGGNWEDNSAVEGWIENMNYTKITAGDQPFPSDRFQCYLPLGGSSGNGAGTYYFKIHSASQHSNFYDKPYQIIFFTNTVAADYVTAPTDEIEPNGGADCGETNNTITLGKRKDATIDNGGCGTDEFALTITTANFDADGDTLWIKMFNTGSGGLGDMSDHFIYGLWSGALGADIQDQIKYQTATDFTNLPSGKGAMNYLNFKPNGNPTQLAGDLDAFYFYYDIDQAITNTQDVLYDYTKYLWTDEDIRGFRLDAVKHFPGWFTGNLLDYLHDNEINPEIVVGENYDYTPSVLKGWIDDVQYNMDADTKENINVRVFDFALRNNLEQACDGFGYDVRNVFNGGIVDGAGGSGFNVVTFVNNHDFRDGDQPCSNNPELAYAYLITNNKLGIPCVYFSDYYEPLNLRYKINGLIEAHTRYIYGATFVDYLSRFSSPYYANYISGAANTSLIYQLSYTESGREVVVAINFSGSTLKVDQTINTANIFTGDTLTDIFAVTPYDFITVQDDNQIYLEVPARSFAVFVEGDLGDEVIDISTPLAIQSSPIKEFTVYPNPANDILYFNIDVSSEKMIIEISDAEGKIVLREKQDTSDQFINIKSLPAGIYFLKMNSEDTVWVSTFIKE